MSAIEVAMSWTEGDAFEIIQPANASNVLDGSKESGLSPMECLLASLCGCMGIDVVMILEKMRCELKAVQIQASGERMSEPPRYFRKIDLEFRIQGRLTEKQAHRAIDLSFEKYCSVFHCFRSDLEIGRRVIVG